MFFSRYSPLTWAATWAAVSLASPMPMDALLPLNHRDNELAVREAMEAVVHMQHLEKRLSADFDMNRSWNNEVLFSGSWTDDVDGVKTVTELDVTCRECWTKGTVVAKLNEDVFKPTVRLEFNSVSAFVNVEIAMNGAQTYAINLYSSNTPAGLGFPGLSVGVVFYVDLVFALTEAVDLTAGFTVDVAEGAFLEASVFGGDIVDHFFDGLQSRSLPVVVRTGSGATFKADLRLRVQCGAEAEFMGIGAGAELGIYANIIEFVAVLETTPECPLQALEWFDLNVGAYAHLDVVVDYTTMGAIPTVSTTLLSAPTFTQCFSDFAAVSPSSSPAETGTVVAPLPPAQNQTGGGGYSSPAETGPSVSTVASSAFVSSTFAASSPYTTFSDIVSIPASLPVSTIATSAVASSIFETSAPYPYPSSSGASGPGTTGYAFGNHSSSSSSSSLHGIAGSGSISSGVVYVTSTLSATRTYTLTQCGAAGAVNCPAAYQTPRVVTQTLGVYTTVCPADAVITEIPTSATTTTAKSNPSSVVHVDKITDVVVLEPCKEPVVATFSAPSSSSSGAAKTTKHHSTTKPTTTSTQTTIALSEVVSSSFSMAPTPPSPAKGHAFVEVQHYSMSSVVSLGAMGTGGGAVLPTTTPVVTAGAPPGSQARQGRLTAVLGLVVGVVAVVF